MFGVCIGLVVRWMTDLGRVGGPYIRLTLLWTRSTITILSKASKALHHPLLQKNYNPRGAPERSSQAIIPPPASRAKGGLSFNGNDVDRDCRCKLYPHLIRSSLLFSSPRPVRSVWTTRSTCTPHQVQPSTTRVTWSPTIQLSFLQAWCTRAVRTAHEIFSDHYRRRRCSVDNSNSNAE